MATFDEASVCPKCGMTGEPGTPKMSLRPGVRIIVVTCKTVLCKWFDTGWTVQINPDGSVPDAASPFQPRGDKQFIVPDGVLADQRIAAAERYAGIPNNSEIPNNS